MQRSYSNRKTKDLVMMAVFFAIIFLQSWIPTLGYITFGAISLTFIQVTVIVSTLMLGVKNGMIVGGFWGTMALVIAYLRGGPFERLVFTNPLISLVPRILMPLILGLIIIILSKKFKDAKFIGAMAGLIGSLLNTCFVLLALGLFAGNAFLQTIPNAQVNELWTIIGGIILANGVPEAILSTILTPLIYVALKRVRR